MEFLSCYAALTFTLLAKFSICEVDYSLSFPSFFQPLSPLQRKKSFSSSLFSKSTPLPPETPPNSSLRHTDDHSLRPNPNCVCVCLHIFFPCHEDKNWLSICSPLCLNGSLEVSELIYLDSKAEVAENCERLQELGKLDAWTLIKIWHYKK